MSQLNPEKTDYLRQRIKEWYQNQEDKSGRKTQKAIRSQKKIGILSRWIISLLPPDNRQLPLFRYHQSWAKCYRVIN